MKTHCPQTGFWQACHEKGLGLVELGQNHRSHFLCGAALLLCSYALQQTAFTRMQNSACSLLSCQGLAATPCSSTTLALTPKKLRAGLPYSQIMFTALAKTYAVPGPQEIYSEKRETEPQTQINTSARLLPGSAGRGGGSPLPRSAWGREPQTADCCRPGFEALPRFSKEASW